MSKMDPGYKALLLEAAQLIAGALNERVDNDEELQEKLLDVNQRMSDGYGLTIGAIALNIDLITVPMPGEKKEGGKSKVSLDFQFGQSSEDEEMRKIINFDEKDVDEMNQLLEQARKEKIEKAGGAAPAGAGKAPQPPAETEAEETNEPADSSRSISEIINSIREAARALNFEQRRLLVGTIRIKSAVLKRFFAPLVEEEQMKNDTLWLQCVQGLINEMQKQSREVLGCPLKETLLDLEEMFKRFSE